MRVPGLSARVQLPVLQRPDAAGIELLPVLVGDRPEIAGLPQGMHYVLAPFAAGVSETDGRRARGYAGDGTVTKGKVGVDLKWLPDAGTIVDGTINPDFSQVESDVVQIGVNERFALFYPEKRPFFLEQVDLLQTPIQAIYTRTITDPLWGARLTSRQGSTSTRCSRPTTGAAGPSSIPGRSSRTRRRRISSPTSASAALRHEIGNSFVGALGTARVDEGGGLQLRRSAATSSGGPTTRTS